MAKRDNVLCTSVGKTNAIWDLRDMLSDCGLTFNSFFFWGYSTFHLQQMRELIAEHKPYIDKMNKTGPQLVELSPTEGASIREKYEPQTNCTAILKWMSSTELLPWTRPISKSTQVHWRISLGSYSALLLHWLKGQFTPKMKIWS